MKIWLIKILSSQIFYLVLFWWLLIGVMWPLCNQPQMFEPYLSSGLYDAWETFTAFYFEKILLIFTLFFFLMSLVLCMRAMSNKQRHGWPKAAMTLLYLCLLLGWLFAFLPGFGRAREPAKRICCQSNLKQIYFSIQQYAADYNDYCPPDLQTLNATDYLTDLDSYRCPSRTRPNPDFSDFDYSGNGRKLNDPTFLLLQDRDQNHPGKYYNSILSDGEIKTGDKIK